MKTAFDIPDAMREFADKSLDQARKAFDHFMASAQKAASDLDASGEAAQEGARDVQAEAIAFAEATIAANFELAQRLVRARDAEEILRIQREFLDQQIAALTDQSRRLAEIAGSGGKRAARR
jgi:phasin